MAEESECGGAGAARGGQEGARQITKQNGILLSREQFFEVMAQFGPVIDFDNSCVLFDYLLAQRLRTLRLLNPHLDIKMSGSSEALERGVAQVLQNTSTASKLMVHGGKVVQCAPRQ